MNRKLLPDDRLKRLAELATEAISIASESTKHWMEWTPEERERAKVMIAELEAERERIFAE